VNAAPWQCKLRPSRQARLLHGALASGALLIVASAPLPALFWLIKIPLLLLMLHEYRQQQRRLTQRRGMLQHKSKLETTAGAGRARAGASAARSAGCRARRCWCCAARKERRAGCG